MSRYTRRPITPSIYVEAFQITDDMQTQNIPAWLFGAVISGDLKIDAATKNMSVNTATGPTSASVNDWIIKSPNGDIFPMKDVDFNSQYISA